MVIGKNSARQWQIVHTSYSRHQRTKSPQTPWIAYFPVTLSLSFQGHIIFSKHPSQQKIAWRTGIKRNRSIGCPWMAAMLRGCKQRICLLRSLYLNKNDSQTSELCSVNEWSRRKHKCIDKNFSFSFARAHALAHCFTENSWNKSLHACVSNACRCVASDNHFDISKNSYLTASLRGGNKTKVSAVNNTFFLFYSPTLDPENDIKNEF